MSEWPTKTLGEICREGDGFIRTGPFGSQLHRSDYTDDPNGIPVVMPKDMARGRIDTASIARIDEGTADRLKQHLLSANDVVLARRGDVGRTAWVFEEDLPAFCGTGSMRVHPGRSESVRPSFLRFFFHTKLASDYLEGHAVGATMPNLNAGIVESLPVPIPPLPIQDSLIAVLEAFDELIENNRRRVEVLEEMARVIYREWFVKFRYPGHEEVPLVGSALGPVPEGWEVRSVGDVARVVRGRSYKSTELVEKGGLPFVNLKCMARGGGFRRDGLKRYTGQFKEEQLVGAGDLVLAVTDLTQGREILARATLVPRLQEGKGVISLDVIRLLPLVEADRLWLFASLGWSDFASRVKEYANGSTVLHLSPSHVIGALVLWPTESLRSRWAEVVEPIFAEINELTDQANAVARLRDLLLPKLVAGQIDVSTLDLDGLPEGSVA